MSESMKVGNMPAEERARREAAIMSQKIAAKPAKVKRHKPKHQYVDSFLNGLSFALGVCLGASIALAVIYITSRVAFGV